MTYTTITMCEKCIHQDVCKYREIDRDEINLALTSALDDLYNVDDEIFEVSLKCLKYKEA